MSADGGSVWAVRDLYYADGGDLAADPNNNSVYWSAGRWYNSAGSIYIMSISKTTNNGTNWTRYNIGIATGCAYALALDPTDSDIIYAGGYEDATAAIYRTTNSGGDWTKLPAAGLSGTVYDLVIDPDNTNILYAGTSSNVYKSTDSGMNWTSTSCSGGYTRALLMHADTIYAGTYSNGIYKSSDAGGTWTQTNDGLMELTIEAFSINPNNYIFVGTDGGSAYRMPIQVGVTEKVKGFTERFAFSAVPNPAINRTLINYQLTKKSVVDLSIYDIQGRLIKVLVNDTEDPGVHCVAWNGFDERNNRVAAGVYFCKLTIEGTAHIQKLVLLK